MRIRIPNFTFKPAAVDEVCRRLYRMGETLKAYSFCFTIDVTFTRPLSSWCKHCALEINVFMVLQFLIWFLTGGFVGNLTRIRSKGWNEMKDKPTDWEEVPEEVWRAVGERLMSRLDIVRFRSVCKQWRSSLPSPTRFPLLVPPPPRIDRCFSIFDNLPYFITEHSIYSADIGPGIQQVLVQVEELDQGRKFRSNVFVPEGVELVSPSISSSTPKLSFIGKGYLLRVALPLFDSLNKRVEGKWDFRHTLPEVRKVVLISSNAEDGINAGFAPASDLSAVALLNKGERTLALLRLGSECSWDTSFCSVLYEDMTTYRDKLCTIDYRGAAFVMDYYSKRMTEIAAPLYTHPELRCRKQVAESCGDLYLMVRMEEPIFKGYKLNFRLRKWQEVENIGNCVFFQLLQHMFPIPKHMLPSNLESLMMKCKARREDVVWPSLLFAHPHNHNRYLKWMEEDSGCYRLLGFTFRNFSPWLKTQEASTACAEAAATTTTTSILSQLDNSIVGRTNYLDLMSSHLKARRLLLS